MSTVGIGIGWFSFAGAFTSRLVDVFGLELKPRRSVNNLKSNNTSLPFFSRSKTTYRASNRTLVGRLALHVEGNAIGGLGLDLQASYKQESG